MSLVEIYDSRTVTLEVSSIVITGAASKATLDMEQDELGAGAGV